MTIEIINCTPHAINYQPEGGEVVTYPPSGILPRLAVEETEVEGMPFKAFSKTTGALEGLPEIQEDVLLIVSGMVFDSVDRKDLIAPNTGKTALRNEKGHIQAVVSFYVKPQQ